MTTIKPQELYPTPPEGTRALLSVERFGGGIWEPCAGRGDMAAVLREAGYTVRASTIETVTNEASKPKQRVIGEMDFLAETDLRHPNIVTNPPFSRAEEVLRKAIDLGAVKICLLLNIKFLAGRKRHLELLGEHPPIRVHVFQDRLTMYPADWEGERSTSTETMAWFVWEPGFRGAPTLGSIYGRAFIGGSAAA